MHFCGFSTCTITCVKGHQFPDGSSITRMICKNGNWIPAKENWVSVPDCQGKIGLFLCFIFNKILKEVKKSNKYSLQLFAILLVKMVEIVYHLMCASALKITGGPNASIVSKL